MGERSSRRSERGSSSRRASGTTRGSRRRRRRRAKRPGLSAIYALTKYDQERACLVAGPAYGIPTVALRLFNTYGPRQALSNPYTGVLAIFASRLLNGRPPRGFEDGLQRRDFVSVHDVARAFALALSEDG